MTNWQKRVAMFLIAGILNSLSLSLIDFPYPILSAGSIPSFLVEGLIALIFFEIMYRTRKWLNWITLLIYFLLFLAFHLFVGQVLFELLYYEFDIPVFSWYYFYDIFEFAESDSGIIFVIGSGLLVLISFFMIGPSAVSRSKSDTKKAVNKVVLEINDHTATRLMCISAITGGTSMRNKILERYQNKFIATAPEFGIDMEIVVGLCSYLANRETMFQIIFFIAGIIGIVISLLDPIGLIFLVIGSAIIMFVKLYQEQYSVLQDFIGNVYNPETIKNKYASDVDPELTRSLPVPNQNLVVYGDFAPFVGAGIDLGGWSFAINIKRPKEQLGQILEVESFQINELYQEIEKGVMSLSIPNLQMNDWFYVSGTDIRNDRIILPDILEKPKQYLSDEDKESIDDFRMRRYRQIYIKDWGNDLIFSIFLRCVFKGDNMFVEVARYLLPPIDNQYRSLPYNVRPNWRSYIRIGFASIFLGIVYSLLSWLILFGKFFEYISLSLGFRERNQRNAIKKDPNYNYGVNTSFREEVSGARYSHYFQKLDREMYVKILDQEILETLTQFLDGKNIDISQLVDKQTSILNSGIIVQGGNVESESIAVGEGAQAHVHKSESSSKKE